MVAGRATEDALRQKNVAESSEQAARENARQAWESEADTRAFAEFLVDSVFSVARPEGIDGGHGLQTTLADALKLAEAEIDEVFWDRPRAEFVARMNIGRSFQHQQDYAAAERNLSRAVELGNTLWAPRSVQVFLVRNFSPICLQTLVSSIRPSRS